MSGTKPSLTVFHPGCGRDGELGSYSPHISHLILQRVEVCDRTKNSHRSAGRHVRVPGAYLVLRSRFFFRIRCVLLDGLSIIINRRRSVHLGSRWLVALIPMSFLQVGREAALPPGDARFHPISRHLCSPRRIRY